MARATRVTRPEIFRAETDYNGGQLVVKYTNGKRAVLFVNGMDVHYAMWNNEVARLVEQMEKNLVKI